jgi:hypothetical protein
MMQESYEVLTLLNTGAAEWEDYDSFDEAYEALFSIARKGAGRAYMYANDEADHRYSVEQGDMVPVPNL